MHEFVVLLHVCPFIEQLLHRLPWFPQAESDVFAAATHSPSVVQQPSQLLAPQRLICGPH
jgi:hypothetical protein